MRLKQYLDRFIETFPVEDHLRMDPVRFVHSYDTPSDQEVVGFIAAAFAYGNVRVVLRSVEAVLHVMGRHPHQFVMDFDPAKHQQLFGGFRHRWNNQTDLAALLWILRKILEQKGTIEAAFAEGVTAGSTTVREAVDHFSRLALAIDYEQWYVRSDLLSRRGVRYFFPLASDGSACKRINLYLRWMVRPRDGVDCGLWTRIRSDQLVVPLDTHVARISRYIGLTDYASPGWSMAEDITRSLRRLDPSDPVRYDFALCHLGIAGDCPKKHDRIKCRECPIQAVCRL